MNKSFLHITSIFKLIPLIISLFLIRLKIYEFLIDFNYILFSFIYLKNHLFIYFSLLSIYIYLHNMYNITPKKSKNTFGNDFRNT